MNCEQQPFGVLTLEQLRMEFEAGDRSKLISAIAFCARHKLVMPEWVADTFLPGAQKWLYHEVRVLDEALGISWPKGMRMSNERNKKKLMWPVFNAIEKLRKTPGNPGGRPLDDNLFDQVGAEFGIGTTTAKKYYYSAKRWMDGIL